MPFKPNYRQFAPPQLRTPSFLPEPVYMDADIPEAQPGLQGPPPALQAPEVQINAQAPNKPKSFSERYQELQKTQPQPIEGWRRPVSKFIEGGVPGLASELLNPSGKRERYQRDVGNLVTEQKIGQSEEGHLADVGYRNASTDAQRKHGAYWEKKATEGPEAYAVGSHGYVDPSGAFHPAEQRDPNPPANYESHLVRVLNDPNASPESKADAQKKLDGMRPPQLGTPRSVPRGGTLIGPDGKLIYQDTREPRKGGSAGGSGKPGELPPPGRLSPTAQGVLDGKVAYHGLSAKDKSVVRNELLSANVGWREPVKLTPQQDGAIKAMNTIDAMIAKLEDKYAATGDIGGVGLWEGSSLGQTVNERGPSWMPGKGPRDGVANRSVLGGISAELLHEKYGSALSKGENERARSFIPSTSDSPQTVIDKLKALKEFHAAKRSEWGVDGQKTDAKRTENGQKTAGPPALSAPGASAPAQPVKMRGPNGNEAMVKGDKVKDAEARGWKVAP